MKLLKSAITVLAVLSLSSTSIFYHYAGEIFILDRLILGYPEMFLSMCSCWVLTVLLYVIIERENKEEKGKLRFEILSQTDLKETARRVLAESDSKQQKLIGQSQIDAALINIQRDKINTLEKALEDISGKYQTSLGAIDEQRKTIDEFNTKMKTIKFPNYSIPIFESKNKNKYKKKKSKKKN